MNQSTNYNFNLPEGTDLVNLLTQLIPNWSNLDTILKGIDDATFANATETVALGVHAITRSNPDSKLLRWIATANFEAGDTFTIDGISTPAALPSGEALGEDSYIAGAVVIASLNADESALTIYVTSGAVAVAADSERLGGELPAYYATKSYADGIKTTADNASAAIALKNLVNTFYDSIAKKLYLVNADGTKGGEILMGTQKNYTFGSGGPITVDISEHSDSEYVSFSIIFPGSGVAANGSVVSVATIKTWTTLTTITQAGSADLKGLYSDGKVTLTPSAAYGVIATMTFND